MSLFYVTKNKNLYLNTLLHYLLFLLSNFITVPFVLPDKHKKINSQHEACNKNLTRRVKNLDTVLLQTAMLCGHLLSQ